jgi:hypothetical protein
LRRNCLVKHIIEGKIGGITVTGKQERRRKQLLDNFEETRGYCKLKEEALIRTLCRTRFERGYRLLARQTTKLLNKSLSYYKFMYSVSGEKYLFSNILFPTKNIFTCNLVGVNFYDNTKK